MLMWTSFWNEPAGRFQSSFPTETRFGSPGLNPDGMPSPFLGEENPRMVRDFEIHQALATLPSGARVPHGVRASGECSGAEDTVL